MKNIIKISIVAILILLAPFSPAIGQDKKTEQKIKIITDDGSGKKVVLDTLFTGNGPDSIKLNNGSVVYIKHGEDTDMMHGDGKHHVYVTSTSSDDKDVKQITVIASDSDEIAGDHDNVVFYNNVSKNTNHEKGSSDTFTVYVDKNDSSSDRTRFVIAKDGMVVTIEGNDEAKTKALAKEIEEKLGVNSNEKKKVESE